MYIKQNPRDSWAKVVGCALSINIIPWHRQDKRCDTLANNNVKCKWRMFHMGFARGCAQRRSLWVEISVNHGARHLGPGQYTARTHNRGPTPPPFCPTISFLYVSPLSFSLTFLDISLNFINASLLPPLLNSESGIFLHNVKFSTN